MGNNEIDSVGNSKEWQRYSAIRRCRYCEVFVPQASVLMLGGGPVCGDCETLYNEIQSVSTIAGVEKLLVDLGVRARTLFQSAPSRIRAITKAIGILERRKERLSISRRSDMGDYGTTMTCRECTEVFTLSKGHTCTTKTAYVEVKVNIPRGLTEMSEAQYRGYVKTSQLAEPPQDQDGDPPPTPEAAWCFCASFYSSTDWIESYRWRKWMPPTIPERIRMALDVTFRDSTMDVEKLRKAVGKLDRASRELLAADAARYYFKILATRADPVPSKPAPAQVPQNVFERPISFEE